MLEIKNSNNLNKDKGKENTSEKLKMEEIKEMNLNIEKYNDTFKPNQNINKNIPKYEEDLENESESSKNRSLKLNLHVDKNKRNISPPKQQNNPHNNQSEYENKMVFVPSQPNFNKN